MSKNPIAVFYHCRLSGGSNVDTKASIKRHFGRQLFAHQMLLVETSGLYDNANEIYIGVNGSLEDAQFVQETMPPGCSVIHHGENAESLLPTFQFMQEWLAEHQDWHVLFFHTKGITRPLDPLSQAWRGCMEHHCIKNWSKCVADLDAGNDAVGCHWLPNRADDPNADRWGGNSFFAGVFFWAKAQYLLTLPKFPDKIIDRHSWFLPELWIGNGKPKIRDYHPGAMTVAGCQQSAK